MADNKNLWWLILIPIVGYGIYRIVKPPTPVGQHTLTIVAGAGGVTTPVAGTYKFWPAQVSVYAYPNAGYRFSHWSGDIGDQDPQSALITFLMTGNKTITANFEMIVTALKVHITIAATVGGHTSLPAGSYEFDEGTIIGGPSGLLAIPDAGYEFQLWAGALNGLQNPLLFVVDVTDEGAVLTAIFAQSSTPGIQLNAGWNTELTYGGSSGALSSVMASIWPYVQMVWALQGGVWRNWDETDQGNADLTTLNTGDPVEILMSQAAFWAWV